MKIAVLGTGGVGETIATKLTSLGHDVKMGSRSATNEKAVAWAKKAGAKASTGTFADAAAFGEIAFLCTNGSGTLAAVELAGPKNLAGKLVVDISNPLDFSKGMPPRLTVCNDDSLGEQVQRALPDAKVVKSLNTCSAPFMVAPGTLNGGAHSMFMAGNDPAGKEKMREILTSWFGWKDVIDLGDITSARGTEMYLALWTRMFGALKTPAFSIQVVR